MTNRAPRMHVVPDMDWQHKNKTQTVSPNFNVELANRITLFTDGRAMREPIPGTIARGRLFDRQLNTIAGYPELVQLPSPPSRAKTMC